MAAVAGSVADEIMAALLKGRTLDRAYKILLTVFRTHPFSMERAKELDVWFLEGYPDLMTRRA